MDRGKAAWDRESMSGRIGVQGALSAACNMIALRGAVVIGSGRPAEFVSPPAGLRAFDGVSQMVWWSRAAQKLSSLGSSGPSGSTYRYRWPVPVVIRTSSAIASMS